MLVTRVWEGESQGGGGPGGGNRGRQGARRRSPGQGGQGNVTHRLTSRGRVKVLCLDVQLVLEAVEGGGTGGGCCH